MERELKCSEPQNPHKTRLKITASCVARRHLGNGAGAPGPRNLRNGSEYGDNFHRRGRYADLSSSKLLGVWSEKRQQKPEMKMMKSMRLIMYAVSSVGVVYRYEPLSNN